MALYNVHELTVDLKMPSARNDAPTIVQNDAVQFVIHLTDRGSPLTAEQLAAIDTVSLASTPHKGIPVVTAGVMDGSKAVFNLGTIPVEENGRVSAMVQMYDVDGRVSSLTFNYNVLVDPTGDEYVPAEYEKTLIQVVMNDAQAKIDELSQVDVVSLTQEVETARGTEADLPSRLNSINQDLAQKPNKGEIGITDLDKNKTQFDQTWMADELLQQVAGTTPVNATPPREGVIRSHLADNSVPFNVLSFVKKSNNLFNKNIVTPGYSISGTTGELVANSSFNVSDFVYVKANQLYSLANVGRWALYDKNRSFISSNTTSSFTTPSNAFYARFSVATASLLTAQVNLGSLAAYDEFEAEVEEGSNGLIVKPSFNTVGRDSMTKDSVDPFAMIPFKKPTNLFNKNDLVANVNFSFSNNGAEIEDTTRDASKYMRVKPKQVYHKGANSIFVNYYDKNKKWGLLEQIGTSSPTFTTPVWCYYIRVSVAKGSVSTFMLSEGDTELPYEEHAFVLRSTNEYPLKINNTLLSGVSTEEEKLIMPYRTYSYTKQPYADVVASLNSSGCTVENLGVGSDGVLELYGLSYGDTTTKPVIFSIGNQHGSEWESVYYGLDFMKIISGVIPFQDPNLLKTLTDTFSFYFIVSANPWGYENSSYVNFNKVNLNRNWDRNWDALASGEGTNQYKGTAPFSEVDLQIVRDKFLELKPYMMIDLHTSGQTPGGFDTGKIYTEYRDLLLTTYNKMFEVYDDAGLPVQEWNIGWNPTSVGWSGLQVSKEGTNCISTVLEQPTYWNGNYGLTALFMLSLSARDHYLGN